MRNTGPHATLACIQWRRWWSLWSWKQESENVLLRYTAERIYAVVRKSVLKSSGWTFRSAHARDRFHSYWHPRSILSEFQCAWRLKPHPRRYGHVCLCLITSPVDVCFYPTSYIICRAVSFGYRALFSQWITLWEQYETEFVFYSFIPSSAECFILLCYIFTVYNRLLYQ